MHTFWSLFWPSLNSYLGLAYIHNGFPTAHNNWPWKHSYLQFEQVNTFFCFAALPAHVSQTQEVQFLHRNHGTPDSEYGISQNKQGVLSTVFISLLLAGGRFRRFFGGWRNSWDFARLLPVGLLHFASCWSSSCCLYGEAVRSWALTAARFFTAFDRCAAGYGRSCSGVMTELLPQVFLLDPYNKKTQIKHTCTQRFNSQFQVNMG